jgi:hypothetical protein
VMKMEGWRSDSMEGEAESTIQSARPDACIVGIKPALFPILFADVRS